MNDISRLSQLIASDDNEYIRRLAPEIITRAKFRAEHNERVWIEFDSPAEMWPLIKWWIALPDPKIENGILLTDDTKREQNETGENQNILTKLVIGDVNKGCTVMKLMKDAPADERRKAGALRACHKILLAQKQNEALWRGLHSKPDYADWQILVKTPEMKTAAPICRVELDMSTDTKAQAEVIWDVPLLARIYGESVERMQTLTLKVDDEMERQRKAFFDRIRSQDRFFS